MIHKLIDGIPTPANLQADFPNTSFPADLSVAVLPDGYVWVTPTAPPECGQFERVVATQPVQTLDGYWLQHWQVVPWTDADYAAWRQTLECGPYQMAQALDAFGLFDSINEAMENAGGMTTFAWKRATVFRRMDPLIETMRLALGKTPEEVDQLFMLAMTK